MDVDNSIPFFPLKYSGVLSSRKVFYHLSLSGDWSAQRLTLTGMVNNIDINNWPTDTVLKNRKFVYFLFYLFSLQFFLTYFSERFRLSQSANCFRSLCGQSGYWPVGRSLPDRAPCSPLFWCGDPRCFLNQRDRKEITIISNFLFPLWMQSFRY